MVIEGCICKLKSGIIEVLAPPAFTILTKRKITAMMRLKAEKDRRFNIPRGMTVEQL